MAKITAFSKTALDAARTRKLDILRCMVVTGCGLALILAGKPLPF
ncbi:hypothetical protein [Erythrobacter rubeus]|nr:hypothetical protein [Erythrobacter rubeus]